MEKVIQMPKGAKYLSEVLYFGSEYGDSLPQNCIFNKVTTGCGGTYVALHSVRPTIIAVPTKALVKDKVTQSKYAHLNILPVSSEYPFVGIPKNCMKIICTYQSLPEVAKYIDIAKWDLVVDEMHLLNKMMNFSMTALQWMMDNFKKFASYCFMSATVSADEFLLKELRGLDRVKAEWQDIKEVSFECYKAKEIKLSIVQIICEHMDGTRQGNAYFFYNSIAGICSIAKYINKNKSFRGKVAVVAGSSEHTRAKLAEVGLDISSPSEYRKINFITSTAHEGVDFYDPEGVTYIVSDNTYNNTKYSLVTTIPQIVGRLRDSKYSGTVTVLFNGTSLITLKTREELEEYISYNIRQAGGFARLYNSSKTEEDQQLASEILLVSSFENRYLRIKNLDVDIEDLDSVVYNKDMEMEVYEDAKLVELEEFELLRTNLYINGEANKDHIAHKLSETVGEATTLENKYRALFSSKNIGVKALCEIYKTNKEECKLIDSKVFEIIESIGIDNADRLHYNLQRMEELAKFMSAQEDDSVLRKVMSAFKVGDIVTKADVKSILQKCGLNKAKATTISEYFEVKDCLSNGQRAVRILSAK